MALIYLASPSIYQDKMRVIRKHLEVEGHTITSRWLDVTTLGNMTPDFARMDIEDIDRAEAFMLYPLRNGDTNPSAGHMWEAGYAYAQDKLLILMGQPTSLFLTIPRYRRCYTLAEAFLLLESLS